MRTTFLVIAASAGALAGFLAVLWIRTRLGAGRAGGVADALVTGIGTWSGLFSGIAVAHDFEGFGIPALVTLLDATRIALSAGFVLLVLRSLSAVIRPLDAGSRRTRAVPEAACGRTVGGGLAALAWIVGASLFVAAGGIHD